jgi:phospholipid/cholesterol/gamma-HCH transport system substrate-binding protein
VRYAGGPKVGHVDKLTIDPNDPSRIDITFSVETDLPVKTDSKVKIMSLSPLGDNHLEILPGGAQAGPAKVGALLPSDPYLDFNAILAQVNDLSPKVQRLVSSLDDLTGHLKVTLDHANNFLSPENQENLSAALKDTHEILKENREPLKTTMQNVSAASKKIEPLIQDLHKTSEEANKALDHIDSLLDDNEDDLNVSIAELRKSLTKLTDITNRVDQTLDVNTENIDELLDNFRRVSQNLKEFTDTIKKRPYTLIRASSPKEHVPGEHK